MSGHFYKKVSRKFPDSLFRPLPEQTKNPATFGGYGVCLGATDPIRTDDLLITSEFPALNVLNRTFEKARNCAGWRFLPEQAEPLFSAFFGKKFPESFPQFPDSVSRSAGFILAAAAYQGFKRISNSGIGTL